MLSASGLRVDGRRAHEVRRVHARVGVSPHADGSALVDVGGTRVLALAHGPRRATRRAPVAGSSAGVGIGDAAESATLTVEYTFAPFANAGARRRRTAGDRAIAEGTGALRGVFSSAVCLHLYPRSEIALVIHVLAADGGAAGALAAAVNAGALAIADSGIAMSDIPAAGVALWTPSALLLDPCGAEVGGAAGAPTALVALLPLSDGVVHAAVDARLPGGDGAALASLLESAAAAARGVHQVLRAALREAAGEKAAARAGRGGVL